MSQLIELVALPIPIHGAEDTYNDFDVIYPQAMLIGLSHLALKAARMTAPGIRDEDVWASGFAGEYSPQMLAITDEAKLARESSAKKKSLADAEWMGFEGDDSNEANVVEREVYDLRQEKRHIATGLDELYEQGLLTPSKRDAARSRIAELDTRIKSLREAVRAVGNLPIYYATPATGILERNAENNPLSYIGEVPGTGCLALYDGRAIAADAELRVTEKSDQQIRIAGLGLHIMRHALAAVRLTFIEE